MDGTHKNGNAKDANDLIKYSFCQSSHETLCVCVCEH